MTVESVSVAEIAPGLPFSILRFVFIRHPNLQLEDNSIETSEKRQVKAFFNHLLASLLYPLDGHFLAHIANIQPFHAHPSIFSICLVGHV